MVRKLKVNEFVTVSCPARERAFLVGGHKAGIADGAVKSRFQVGSATLLLRMFTLRDRRTGEIFDRRSDLGDKRRHLLERSVQDPRDISVVRTFLTGAGIFP